MKMPDRIPEAMLAPCGVNCFACAGHLRAANPCPSCNMGKTTLRGSPKICAKRRCTAEKGHAFCFECVSFPCGRIRDLDRRYVADYGFSIVEDGRRAKRMGLSAYMRDETARWRCGACGGVVAQHRKKCSECGMGE